MSRTGQKGRVIVTYGRSLIALMIAKSLGSRGVDVIGCDSVNMTVLSFSKHVSRYCIYAPPDKDEDQFIDDLLRIVSDNKPDDGRPYVLMPTFRESLIIAKHKDLFEEHIVVACPNYDAIRKVARKDTLARTTQDLDIESPKTWLPGDEQDLESIVKEASFPVFIKPPDGVGGRGISKIWDAQDLKTAFKDLQTRYPGEQILIQSLAKGTDYCFCGLFDQGKLVASMVYHNILKFPNEAGPGVIRETVDSDRFDAIAEKLMGPLRWHGVSGIDFVWDEDADSSPMIIEVNPRFWVGLDHSIASNVDFPWLLFQLYTAGEVQDQASVKIGQKSSVPLLSTMAQAENLFSEAIKFDDLEKQWPAIKKHLKDYKLQDAALVFKEALKNGFNFEQSLSKFQSLRKEAQPAKSIPYTKDDPFIGLGVLFVLGSLLKYGELPPEVKH